MIAIKWGAIENELSSISQSYTLSLKISLKRMVNTKVYGNNFGGFTFNKQC
jgi:hypothetical protein